MGNEYIGKRGQSDIHAIKPSMGCVACHKAEEMHAAAPAGLSRYHSKKAIACTDCHKEIKIQNHKLEASKTVLRDTLPRTGPTGCVQCHPKGP